MLGLNLLRLLVQNRTAEFHTELELLSAEAHASAHVKHAVALEQHIMEGAYNKVLAAAGAAPDASYTWFIQALAATVREEIGACAEVAYASLSLAAAQALLRLDTPAQAAAFAAKVRRAARRRVRGQARRATRRCAARSRAPLRTPGADALRVLAARLDDARRRDRLQCQRRERRAGDSCSLADQPHARVRARDGAHHLKGVPPACFWECHTHCLQARLSPLQSSPALYASALAAARWARLSSAVADSSHQSRCWALSRAARGRTRRRAAFLRWLWGRTAALTSVPALPSQRLARRRFYSNSRRDEARLHRLASRLGLHAVRRGGRANASLRCYIRPKSRVREVADYHVHVPTKSQRRRTRRRGAARAQNGSNEGFGGVQVRRCSATHPQRISDAPHVFIGCQARPAQVACSQSQPRLLQATAQSDE